MLSAAVRRDERSGVRKFEEKLGRSEETVAIDTATFSVGRDIRLHRLTVSIFIARPCDTVSV